ALHPEDSVTASTRSERAHSLAVLTTPPEPSLARAAHPPELCGPEDRFHDYILAEYEPVAPALGKQRSLNVLVESFALAGLERAKNSGGSCTSTTSSVRTQT